MRLGSELRGVNDKKISECIFVGGALAGLPYSYSNIAGATLVK